MASATTPAYRASAGLDAGDGRSLTGYAIKWFDGTRDTVARIDSPSEGRFIELVVRGAATKTIASRPGKVKVLYQHGSSPLTGYAPIAEPFTEGGLVEDDTGLRFSTRLLPGIPDLVWAGLRAGVYGSSIGFTVMREDFDDRPPPTEWNPDAWPVRRIREIKLREISVVTWPAYSGATAGVRSMSEEVAFARLVSKADTHLLQRLHAAHAGGPTVGTTASDRAAFARLAALSPERIQELAAYWDATVDSEQKAA